MSSSLPRPLPAHSRALRRHRIEVELVVDRLLAAGPCPVHEDDDPDCRPERGGACLGRHRRVSIETGRFRMMCDARRWAIGRLVELDEKLRPAAVLTGYAADTGWRPTAIGLIWRDEALEELDR